MAASLPPPPPRQGPNTGVTRLATASRLPACDNRRPPATAPACPVMTARPRPPPTLLHPPPPPPRHGARRSSDHRTLTARDNRHPPARHHPCSVHLLLVVKGPPPPLLLRPLRVAHPGWPSTSRSGVYATLLFEFQWRDTFHISLYGLLIRHVASFEFKSQWTCY
jgi:hypothetical protein